MTVAETQALWRVQNMRQRFFFNKYARIWFDYYQKQGRILADNLNESNPSLLIFLKEDVEEIFAKMYADTGGYFAKFGYNMAKKPLKAEGEFTAANMLTWEQIMTQYAMTQGAQSIVSITETGKALAQKIIQLTTAEALEQGLSINDTERLIERAIKNEWKIAGKFNAERIARTEVLSAANEGSFQGALSTGLDLQKTWLTVMDGRERASHAEVNNTTIDMDKPFQVGGSSLMKPGAKNGRPEDVINCRCGLAYVPQFNQSKTN